MAHFEETTAANEETTTTCGAIYITVKTVLSSLGSFVIYRCLQQTPVIALTFVIIENIAQPPMSGVNIAGAAIVATEDVTQDIVQSAAETAVAIKKAVQAAGEAVYEIKKENDKLIYKKLELAANITGTAVAAAKDIV
ncbi:MAG: hypothetical protein WCP46_03340 [Alphaproteobacteria bacterium]|jgi:hypothetical protein